MHEELHELAARALRLLERDAEVAELFGGSQTLTVTMTRADIEIPTVRSTVLGNRILYLRIYQFGSKTSADFASALKTGVSGANGVILDLRGDPGGFISAADDVVTQFVASGETFETVVARVADEVVRFVGL